MGEKHPEIPGTDAERLVSAVALMGVAAVGRPGEPSVSILYERLADGEVELREEYITRFEEADEIPWQLAIKETSYHLESIREEVNESMELSREFLRNELSIA